MEVRKNRRGVTEHFVTGAHLKLYDLKVKATNLGNRYLSKEDIPEYPRPEFQVSHLKHDTDRVGLEGIRRDGGFRTQGRSSLLWWSLAVKPGDLRSAKIRLQEEIFPDIMEEQASWEPDLLAMFASSPAFKETSRLGSYRFTFPVEEVLEAYSVQFCDGAQPVMQVYETVLYKQEVMYVVLVDRPANQKYPLLGDDLSAVCGFRKKHFIWRPEAMCETHSYELVRTLDGNQMEATELLPSDRKFYVWDNVAIALHVEEGQVLNFDAEQLRKNLKFCDRGNPLLSSNFDSFEEAENFVESLGFDCSSPLEKECPLH